MSQRLRALLPLVLVAGLLGVPTAVAGSSSGSGDNSASAISERDGKRVSDFAFSIERQAGGVVDNRNQAEAYSSCVRCGATAIAFQIVLVSGTPSEVRPVNVAAAVNERCTDCETYAGARQFVRVNPEPVELTDDGEEQVERIRSTLKRLSRSKRPALEIASLVDAQADRLKAVLDAELVTAGGDDEDADEQDEDDEDEEVDDD